MLKLREESGSGHNESLLDCVPHNSHITVVRFPLFFFDLERRKDTSNERILVTLHSGLWLRVVGKAKRTKDSGWGVTGWIREE